ncbi:MAG: hypothetical protein QM784_09935 [Polyangiaceae bacterium]
MGDRSIIGALGLALLSVCVACGSDDKQGGGANPPTKPVDLVASDFTYSLTEGTATLPLFTTPATHRLTSGDRAPAATSSGLNLSAAKREFEPVQLVLGPGSGKVTVRVEPFANLGNAQRITVAQAGFVDGVAETLTSVPAGGAIELNADAGTALWITVFVPPDAPAGDHTTSIALTREGEASVSAPLRLHVFDFTLPPEAHFSTQINVDVSGLVPSGGTVDDAKAMLFEHRMTPTSATWPSGFAWPITWDNEQSTTRCTAFWDEPTEGDEYAIRTLSRRYLLGEGWNGVGFRDAELFQFVDNSTPRPATFCGIARGDHFGTDAYNQAWSDWLSALDDYLVAAGLVERGYYYVQNEPQNDADHRLAAHLCRLTKAAAPHLRIAISEEPKPEIAEDAAGACGYDIWIAHVRAYQEAYAWLRQREHGEAVWFYSLDHDPDPYFNPTLSTNQGMHERIIPWAAYSHRIRGWAYYDGGRFFDGAMPRVRAELLREGFEDYEYLWLANGSAHPAVDATSAVDPTVKSVAASMTSWTQNADALMALRHQLGRYLGKEVSTLPTLQVESSRPRGAYYLNFQDPEGEPAEEPLVVDGKTFIKIGWDAYDAKLGYGFRGENIHDPGIALYGYDDVSSYSVLQRSYIYDDYGRDNLFEFDLAPGRYRVTVGVGRPSKGYPNDPNNITIEGQHVIDDEVTTDAAPVIERAITLDITDGSLSMVVGGRSAKTGEYAYTFLGYLTVEPVE